MIYILISNNITNKAIAHMQIIEGVWWDCHGNTNIVFMEKYGEIMHIPLPGDQYCIFLYVNNSVIFIYLLFGSLYK